MKKLLVLFAVFFLVLVSTSAYAVAVFDCNNGGRYEDMGDGTVQDCRTGLIWLKDANCTDTSNGIANNAGYLSWSDTMKWVKGLGDGLCELTDGSSAGDWRLPTKAEWMAMVASARKQGIIPFTNSTGTGPWTYGDVFNYSFSCWNTNAWSSTTVLADTTHAWYINFGAGDIMQTDVDQEPFGICCFSPCPSAPPATVVMPVRGGQSGEFGSVIIQ